MAGLSNYRPNEGAAGQQKVEVGFVIVTEDCEGGMVDIHDRKPVVLKPEDALRWSDPATQVEEAYCAGEIPTHGRIHLVEGRPGGEPG